MTLRSKLILTFSGILVCFCIMIALVFNSFKNIEQNIDVLSNVDSSIIDGLIAQGRALRMSVYRNPNYAQQAQEKFTTALQSIETIRPKIQNNTEALKKLDIQEQYIRSLQKIVSDMESEYIQLNTIMNNLMPIASNVDKNLHTLIERIEESLQTRFLPREFATYKQLNKTYAEMIEVRLAARVYSEDPSDANEHSTLEQLDTFLNTCEDLKIFATEQHNIATIEAIVTSAEAYKNAFISMVTTRGNLADSLAELRDTFAKLVEQSVIISQGATHNLFAISTRGINIMLYSMLAVSLLCIIIAVTLTKSVLKQLGKDPAELEQLATRVTHGDYSIDESEPKVGVYERITLMVKAIKEHIENARTESDRAQQESDAAKTAMKHAEQASQEAQSKTQVMQAVATRLDDVITIVSSASTELSAQIEQAERGASEQATRIAETATAVEQMNSTVLEVAQNAGTAADLSTNTREKAQEGTQMVYACITSIDNVQKDALTLKQDMEALSEHAKNISQIMSVISDIADQTNLLALNAAIEAARAGDAGRGFAVVADEVRKLAEKTMSSTTDVGNAIRAIQESSTASTKQVEVTVKNVDQATELAGRCGAVLKDILDMAEVSADQVRAIATAAEEQSASSEEIAQSIGQVNTIAEETSHAMQESSRAITELSEQTQILTELIVSMKEV